jgi:hypothetical protein
MIDSTLHSPYYVIAPDMLCLFRRPNITRSLNDHLLVEIENLRGSPGLSYIRFYNKNRHVVIPRGLLCFDLVAACAVEHMMDFNDNPAFILSDTSWYSFCSGGGVLLYVHGAGIICLPNEVVSPFLLVFFHFTFSYPYTNP